jgi:hypothetical protein
MFSLRFSLLVPCETEIPFSFCSVRNEREHLPVTARVPIVHLTEQRKESLSRRVLSLRNATRMKRYFIFDSSLATSGIDFSRVKIRKKQNQKNSLRPLDFITSHMPSLSLVTLSLSLLFSRNKGSRLRRFLHQRASVFGNRNSYRWSLIGYRFFAISELYFEFNIHDNLRSGALLKLTMK